MPIPPLDRESVEKALESLLKQLGAIKGTKHDSKEFDLLWKGRRFPPKIVVEKAAEIQYGKPLPRTTFSSGKAAGQANVILSKLGFQIVPKTKSGEGDLPLVLHGRYGRMDIYAAIGIKYDQQQRHLNVGLSPRCPDGGYFIFVTLNKEELEPAHDYDDQLFADHLIWITRRDVDDSDPDYVNLRDPNCRVSLFARTNTREEFVYGGELKYHEHNSFVDPKTGRPQIKFVWDLKKPLEDELLQELTFGIERTHRPEGKAAVKPAKAIRSRAPSSFDEFKKAYSYILGGPADRTVVPEHQNYQVKLKSFLASQGVQADMEQDFVDVRFSLPETDCIGEIKVTRNLTLAQAFRAALGQVIEYGYLRCPRLPHMIIFLDQPLDPGRLKIATAFRISVVTLEDKTFTLLNPEAAPRGLTQLFEVYRAEGA